MREDVFSTGCDFSFGGAQAVHNVAWSGGRGIFVVPSGTTFNGGAGLGVTAYANDPLGGPVAVGAPAGLSLPITAPGNYVFDAPAGALQFSVALAAGGDQLQVNQSIFVEKL
jgi:hypothetical protein